MTKLDLFNQRCALCASILSFGVILNGPGLTRAISLCCNCLGRLETYSQYTLIHIDLHHGQGHQPSAPEILDRLRCELGFTKTEFANSVGYTQSHITRVLAEQASISVHFAFSVEEAFGLPALHLLHRQNVSQLDVVAEAVEAFRGNPRKGNVVDIDEAQVEEDYRNSNAIRHIAEKYEVSYGTIWRILDKRDVPVQPFGGPVEGRPVGELRGLRPHRRRR